MVSACSRMSECWSRSLEGGDNRWLGTVTACLEPLVKRSYSSLVVVIVGRRIPAGDLHLEAVHCIDESLVLDMAGDEAPGVEPV